MKHGWVVSDLHIFAARSDGARWLPELNRTARESDFLVLNGDIFDFRWTRLPTVAQTVQEAARMMGVLALANPACDIHYVLGNHDCLEPFVRELEKLAMERANFRLHHTHVRLGPVLFLHGDLALGGKKHDPWTRPLMAAEKRKGPVAGRVYRWAVTARLHRVPELLHGRNRTARRIHGRLNLAGDSRWQGVERVYFGHTHRPYASHVVEGVEFHNTGSAIRHGRHNFAKVELP